jgi:serine protease AprX
MKIKLLAILLIGIVLSSHAQVGPDKYYIQFTDKNDSPYSIDNPGEYMTQRAIDRRNRQGIEITENDIPVNQTYLLGVESIGVQLLNPTKWLNGVTVYTEDTLLIAQIETLPYVSGSMKISYNSTSYKSKFPDNSSEITSSNYTKSTSTLDYGASYGQIDQINGISLHEKGYLGEGMLIAVLDAGFSGVIEHPVFEHLWSNNMIHGTKDFVYKDGNVYEGSQHGKSVLSCMAANLSGEMIGTSPQAEYWLLRSEQDPGGENIVEEFNWVSAAEFADSVGADIVNSSLSYFTFDSTSSIWDHKYEDLDGNTAIATIGADIAASKGMIICNSAGNSGSYVGAPADGDSVLTVGAVDGNGIRSGFSSHGPTIDDRIKPNVMAWGSNTTIARGIIEISYGSGTSFSSPVMAGMVACLWQSHPNMTAIEVQQSIMESGNKAADPDTLMGWGIPNFKGADSILTSIRPPLDVGRLVSVGPNPFIDFLMLNLNTDSAESINIEIFSITGSLLYKEEIEIVNNIKNIKLTNGINTLTAGTYFIKVGIAEKSEVIKIVKAQQ